jgi:hypothetical protein
LLVINDGDSQCAHKLTPAGFSPGCWVEPGFANDLHGAPPDPHSEIVLSARGMAFACAAERRRFEHGLSFASTDQGWGGRWVAT